MLPGKELAFMEKFYFTYGTAGQPYRGGWTEVIAPGYEAACAAFRAVHPDRIPGVINCCSVYAEKGFLKSGMAGPDGNFGFRCHETITLSVEVHG